MKTFFKKLFDNIIEDIGESVVFQGYIITGMLLILFSGFVMLVSLLFLCLLIAHPISLLVCTFIFGILVLIMKYCAKKYREG
jgi:hypothetical protein